jgi:hypothetical protein
MMENYRVLWENIMEKSYLEIREVFTEENNIKNETTMITRICLFILFAFNINTLI